MTPCFLRLSAAFVLGTFLAGTARAEAGAPASTIKDEAGLFQSETITQADAEIQAIRKTFHLDLFVETVATIPPEERKWLRFWDRRQVVQFLARKARERAEAAKVDGIFVVIYGKKKRWWKGGNDVQVLVWPESQAARFPAHDCEALRSMLVHELYEGHYDAALLDLVKQVRARLQARASGQEIDADAIRPGFLAILIGSLLGVYVLLVLVRLRLRRTSPQAANAGVPRAERPLLMASLFGTPASYWVTDRMLTAVPPAPGSPPAEEPPAPPAASLEEDEQAMLQPTDENTENAPNHPPLAGSW